MNLEECFSPKRASVTPTNSVLLPLSDLPSYLNCVLKGLGLHTEARTSFITYDSHPFLINPSDPLVGTGFHPSTSTPMSLSALFPSRSMQRRPSLISHHPPMWSHAFSWFSEVSKQPSCLVGLRRSKEQRRMLEFGLISSESKRKRWRTRLFSEFWSGVGWKSSLEIAFVCSLLSCFHFRFSFSFRMITIVGAYLVLQSTSPGEARIGDDTDTFTGKYGRWSFVKRTTLTCLAPSASIIECCGMLPYVKAIKKESWLG